MTDTRERYRGRTCAARGCVASVIPSAHLDNKMYCGSHFTDEERYE